MFFSVISLLICGLSRIYIFYANFISVSYQERNLIIINQFIKPEKNNVLFFTVTEAIQEDKFHYLFHLLKYNKEIYFRFFFNFLLYPTLVSMC